MFGQQFVIENRPGAGGTLAAEAVARAPADGHTLFMGSPSQITIAPTLTKTSYDPVKDFAPISLVGTNPFVLTAHPSVPAKTLTEFLAYARSHPEQIPYAHAGNGTIVHLAMVVFQRRAGIEMMPVVYKGGASQVLNDVVGGHMADLPFAPATGGAARQHRRAAPARRNERGAHAADTRRSDLRGIRVPGVQDPHLERPDGAGRDARGPSSIASPARWRKPSRTRAWRSA